MNGKQLKNSILQWAIQGKLVPQDPNDEPASVLLEKIRTEKARLIKEGKIKKDKNESFIFRGDDNSYYEKFLATGEVKCIDEEIPFEIPQGWEWSRMGSIGDWGAGATPAKGNTSYYGGNILWLRTGELNNSIVNDTEIKITDKALKECSLRMNKAGDVLIAMYGATIGKVAIAGCELTTNQACCACTPIGIFNYYLFYFLMGSQVDFIKKGEGGAQPNISREKLVAHLMPIPPIQEQHRIVERIKDVLPLTNKYALSQIALDELNRSINDKLKKSILQEAIQGKLVPQISEEGTAQELLEQIKTEKEKLVKDGKLKKSALTDSVIFKGDDNKYFEKIGKTITDITNEIPFEIPATWQWVRLDDICSYIQRGKSPKYSPIKKYPVIAQKCNQWAGFCIDKAQFIDPNSLPSYAEERLLQDGDLMWNSTGLGTLGRMAIYKSALNPYELAVADSHVTVIRPLKAYVLSQYLYYYFASDTVQSVIEDKSAGSTKQKELSTTTVKNYLVPIPPYREQQRIVEKIKTVTSIMSR
ncbi:restriction endonuclease subunit S [Bacteroides xylanisolvens]|uniref:restriction endonuclease subunit S n=1 Tax=Bacteroides xylanisolvens TaxID=371601 RepID=UPI00374F37AE